MKYITWRGAAWRGEGVGTHKARSYTTKFSLKRPRHNTTLQQGESELGVIDKLCKHLSTWWEGKDVVPVPSLILIRLLCSAQDEQCWIQLTLSIIFPTDTQFRAENFKFAWSGIVLRVFCEYFHRGMTTTVYIVNVMWYKTWLKRRMIPSEKLFSTMRSLSSFRRLPPVQKEKFVILKVMYIFGGNWATSQFNLGLCQTEFDSIKMERLCEVSEWLYPKSWPQHCENCDKTL